MPVREQDDLPYRSPVTNRAATKKVSKDTDEYSTLREVHATLQEGIDSLYKDFNAFEIIASDMPEESAAKLLADIRAKQIAFDILQPLLDQVDTAVKKVDNKFGG